MKRLALLLCLVILALLAFASSAQATPKYGSYTYNGQTLMIAIIYYDSGPYHVLTDFKFKYTAGQAMTDAGVDTDLLCNNFIVEGGNVWRTLPGYLNLLPSMPSYRPIGYTDVMMHWSDYPWKTVISNW